MNIFSKRRVIGPLHVLLGETIDQNLVTHHQAETIILPLFGMMMETPLPEGDHQRNLCSPNLTGHRGEWQTTDPGETLVNLVSLVSLVSSDPGETIVNLANLVNLVSLVSSDPGETIANL